MEPECIGEIDEEKEECEKMILLSWLKLSGLTVELCMQTPNKDFEN